MLGPRHHDRNRLRNRKQRVRSRSPAITDEVAPQPSGGTHIAESRPYCDRTDVSRRSTRWKNLCVVGVLLVIVLLAGLVYLILRRRGASVPDAPWPRPSSEDRHDTE